MAAAGINGRKKSFQGSFQDIIQGTKGFAAAAPIRYPNVQEQPADPEAIAALEAEIVQLQNSVPSHDSKWSMPWRAFLHYVDGGVWTDPPTRHSCKIKACQDEAHKLRSIDYHVRRRWYRNSRKDWMAAFPRPEGDAIVVEAPAPLALQNVAHAVVAASPITPALVVAHAAAPVVAPVNISLSFMDISFVSHFTTEEEDFDDDACEEERASAAAPAPKVAAAAKVATAAKVVAAP